MRSDGMGRIVDPRAEHMASAKCALIDAARAEEQDGNPWRFAGAVRCALNGHLMAIRRCAAGRPRLGLCDACPFREN
eukprot:5936166-Prymnesium_polylepis.3